jgi:Arc/MetJ-type ribon-helix-helix transcriptional regulator
MTIELKPEHQRTIELAVQSGAYRDFNEVLDQAFDILREQLRFEDWMGKEREGLASQIATGFAQAERGELMDSEEALTLLRQRRAEPAENARMSAFQLTPQATKDLDGIWWFIAADNHEAANRVEREIIAC